MGDRDPREGGLQLEEDAGAVEGFGFEHAAGEGDGGEGLGFYVFAVDLLGEFGDVFGFDAEDVEGFEIAFAGDLDEARR